jgi:hypothetical protein
MTSHAISVKKAAHSTRAKRPHHLLINIGSDFEKCMFLRTGIGFGWQQEEEVFPSVLDDVSPMVVEPKMT